jgi:hypothetical protein
LRGRQRAIGCRHRGRVPVQLIVTLREYNVATRYIDGPFSPLLNQAVTDKA